jgi:hypothetical protein
LTAVNIYGENGRERHEGADQSAGKVGIKSEDCGFAIPPAFVVDDKRHQRHNQSRQISIRADSGILVLECQQQEMQIRLPASRRHSTTRWRSIKLRMDGSETMAPDHAAIAALAFQRSVLVPISTGS